MGNQTARNATVVDFAPKHRRKEGLGENTAEIWSQYYKAAITRPPHTKGER